MKRNVFLLCVMMICSMFSGCTAPTMQKDDGTPLTAAVYCQAGEDMMLVYNMSLTENEPKITLLPKEDLTAASNTDLNARLDLLTKQKPDLYFFSSDVNGLFYSLLSSSAFADLNPMLEQSDLDLSAYNQQVLDTGLVRGKRLFIPTAYRINAIMTSQETMDALQISSLEFRFDNWTELNQKFNLDTKQHLFNDRDFSQFNGYDYFHDMLFGAGIDLQTDHVDFNTEAFRSSIRGYKDYTQQYGLEQSAINESKVTSSGMEMMTPLSFNRPASLLSGDPDEVFSAYKWAQRAQRVNQPRIFAMHSYHDPQKYAAYVTSVVAINANSKSSKGHSM